MKKILSLILIFSFSFLASCEEKERNIPFKKIDISDNEEEYRKKLGEYYDIKGRVTVPQIIINGKRIGGFDDLEKLNNSGNLDSLLN